MSVKTSGMSLNLAWITVSDFEKAVAYYTDVLGLELLESNLEMGWAELRGEGGATLGICKAQEGMEPGVNAVITFTVADLEEAKKGVSEHGVTFIGEVIEVPGHVKLQLCEDPDGNQYHLCEMLD